MVDASSPSGSDAIATPLARDGYANVYRAVVALIREGKHISATLLLRNEFGLGLSEARHLTGAICESIAPASARSAAETPVE